MPGTGSVTVHIDAAPEEVWDLVSEVTKIGRYSPETFEAEWIDGATGPAGGARFRGHVKRNGKGPIYWTTCTVLTCEPCREVSLGVGATEAKILNVWGYHLQPPGKGTDVTESFQLKKNLPLRLYWTLFGWSRGRTNRNGMQT